MTENVIEGPWKGRQAPDWYDGKVCPCGSAWFQLFMPDEANRPAGVCMDKAGHITGYAGFFRCIECDRILSA